MKKEEEINRNRRDDRVVSPFVAIGRLLGVGMAGHRDARGAVADLPDSELSEETEAAPTVTSNGQVLWAAHDLIFSRRTRAEAEAIRQAHTEEENCD